MSNGSGTVTIPLKDLREIVEKALGTKFPEAAEVVIGGPIIVEGDLQIGFAWDTDDRSPLEWATGKPYWLGDGK